MCLQQLMSWNSSSFTDIFCDLSNKAFRKLAHFAKLQNTLYMPPSIGDVKSPLLHFCAKVEVEAFTMTASHPLRSCPWRRADTNTAHSSAPSPGTPHAAPSDAHVSRQITHARITIVAVLCKIRSRSLNDDTSMMSRWHQHCPFISPIQRYSTNGS